MQYLPFYILAILWSGAGLIAACKYIQSSEQKTKLGKVLAFGGVWVGGLFSFFSVFYDG